MKTTLRTTIALAVLSLIIGCGEQEPEITGDDIYRAGYKVALEAEHLDRLQRSGDEGSGKLARITVNYQNALEHAQKLRDHAIETGMKESEAQRWYQLGINADTSEIFDDLGIR